MPLDQDQFKAIISGRRADVTARIARFLLRVASLGYSLAVRGRNGLYDLRLLRAHKAKVPVICVGNLTTGGTGKTPLVIYLARLLSKRELHVAILTRGYRSRRTENRGQRTEDSTLSDEPAELAGACPDVPIVVNPDRVAGAGEAIGKHKAQVLLMDDGFQHRRLARDLDIVVIDATVPFGYGHLLPAGLLREPVNGLRRAGAMVLTRCDLATERAVSEIEAQVLQINPDLVIARSVHAPVSVHHADGSNAPLSTLRGRRVFAFCGLGNPASFLRTVEACGGELLGMQTFNDHHSYSDHDLVELNNQARTCGAELLLTSQKDWTKIAALAVPKGPSNLAYLAVEIRFTAGAESLTALMDQLLGGTIPPS